MSATRRVLDTPELINSIFSFLHGYYLIRLMRVSPSFFRIAGPLIWRDVPGLDIILALIRGTVIRRACITLPDKLDLTRLEVYAPWIQRLEVFNPLSNHRLANSDGLIAIALTQPILPVLRALTLTTDIEANPELELEDLVLFTKLFLCPTLIEIRHVPDASLEQYLDAGGAYSLAQMISSVCPSLQVLEIYPNRKDFEYGGHSGLVSSTDEGFPRILSGFSQLRSFSSSAFIFNPRVLEVLGRLPLLESLGMIDACTSEETPPMLDEDFKIPATWFPKLRHLQIYDMHPHDISVMWKQPPLVQNLVSVTVKCYPCTPDQDEEEEEPDGQEWIDGFIADLARSSPHVEKLELDFDVLGWIDQSYSLSPDSREDLDRLPLRSIDLGGIKLGGYKILAR
ncbi:hypothetical protein BDV93DRAFT_526538 [Ceratobasidium sp. AG-I]|nr:hypothetical protein BDV93DRAFT_526538 [Ceratobasidium sp. AG-I]